MDGIFPALLQEGWRVVVPYLVRIFYACLDTDYVPIIWHQVKVVFIPKPDRNFCSEPRYFRLINLTSFLLKTMEKLIDRFLRIKLWL
jgi:hypothetical protein